MKHKLQVAYALSHGVQRSTAVSRIILGLTLACAVTATSAIARENHFQAGPHQTTLIELYTSEGCSSCPPAERWLSKFSADPRLWQAIVPLAFHVDYWDELGWPDPFARASHSDRQRQLAAGGAVSSVYTPGFVVDGAVWRGWFHGVDLAVSTPEVGELEVVLADSALTIRWHPRASGAACDAHIALLGGGIEREIAHGENAGRRLRHDFVVLAHVRASLAPRAGGFEQTLGLPQAANAAPRHALAVWVEDATTRRPLQATGGWLD